MPALDLLDQGFDDEISGFPPILGIARLPVRLPGSEQGPSQANSLDCISRSANVRPPQHHTLGPSTTFGHPWHPSGNDPAAARGQHVAVWRNQMRKILITALG